YALGPQRGRRINSTAAAFCGRCCQSRMYSSESEAMKHLMYGAALAAVLVVSASAWAQGQTTPPATAAPTIKLPEPSEPSQAPAAKPATATSQTATATPQTATAAPPRRKRHVKRARRYAREYPYYEENYY